MALIIDGEYNQVSRQSLNPDRLRRAHSTPCDPAMAYFLIAVMHDFSFGKAAPMPKVRLRVPRSGKHVARGRGGNRIEKKSDGTYVNRGYVSLPETPYNPMTDRTCIGKLRIGLVCHEYAHAIEMLRFGHSDHGPRFTMILDSLLFETEKYWTKEAAIAAEVKS